MKFLSFAFTIVLAFAANTAVAQFTAGRVVVLRVGSTSASGNSGFLEEYLPSTASQASPAYSVTLPNDGVTSNATSIVFGNNSAFGFGLNLSADGALVVIGGYANMLAAGAVDSVTIAAGGAYRVVGTVRYDGTYARPFIGSSTLFSGSAFRSATSDGFGNFWAMANAGGTLYLNTQTSVQPTTGRANVIANGNLYYSLAASVRGFTGLPTASGGDSAVLVLGNASPSSSGFAIPPNPTAGSVAYVGDVTATSPATESGVKRYTFDGTSWTYAYTIILPSPDKPQHIAVDFSGVAPVIYAVHGVAAAAGNKLYAVTDNGPGAINATIVTLATAPAGNAFRGVVLAPQQPALPSFTVQPANTTNNYGATAVFGPVSASGANPNGYSWKKGNVTLIDGGNISGATTPTLTIANITGSDAGTYYAVASNNGGSVDSNPAILALAGSSITTQLVSRTNVAGTVATFTVVSGGPAPLSYAWLQGVTPLSDGPSPSGSGATISGSGTATLTITGVQAADAGNYTVTVTDGSTTQSSSTASLTVLDPPIVTTQPGNQDRAVGGTANFSVVATGGSLFYQWFKGLDALADGPTGSGATVSGAQSSSLTIAGVQVSDAGSYSVTVTNLAGTTSSDPATLTVGQAPTIGPIPSSTNLPGSTVSFAATVTGTGPLTYTWRHNGTVLVSDGLHILGAETDTLVIDTVDIPDRRLYTLTVSNAYGNASASALLFIVTGLPQPNTVPNLILYEPFNYPIGPFPAVGFYSWENLINIYNQQTGQPAYWFNASGGLNAAVRPNDLAQYTGVSRQPPGLYPWPGIDGSGSNMWTWSSAPNNNHLKFGGVSSGSAYFSFVLHVDQSVPLNGGQVDVIAGFTSGDSAAGGVNVDTYNYKLCTMADTGGDGYVLGVFKGGGTTISPTSINGQWAPQHLLRGQIHFVVGSYEIHSGGTVANDDVVSLWIDPDRSTFGVAEELVPVPDAGGMITNWNNNAAVTEFGLRGSVPPTSKRIADLRIGKTWASVTQPYYPTLKIGSVPPNVAVSWPAKDSFGGHGYLLDTAAEVTGPFSPDLNPPMLEGTNNVVTEEVFSQQFWQLRYPPRSGVSNQY